MANMLAPRIELKEFARQYILGNIIAIALALYGALVVQQQTGSAVLVAISASAIESVVWYIYLLLYYVNAKGDTYSLAVHHIVTDFGLAEVLDSFFFRPGLMYLLPLLTHNQPGGIVVATVLADVIYTAIGLNRQRHRLDKA